MKKAISLVVAIILLLSMCLPMTAVYAAEAVELKPLPKVGDVISGFKVTEIGEMELTNSKTVLFEHEKTGAKLFFIQSRDIDRSFSITFKTPAVDDTGVNHILEHITVSGSEKYPLKNVLFTVANQTYSTFVNAMTGSSYTTYPLSSMSEDQLLKLTDVYMDCVYNPAVHSNKNIFLREAWRYEMESADAPLYINGTVYNEMKGSLGNISTAAYYNVLKTLYPNSYQASISGGDPEQIKTLTYEQLIDTHEAYYHPSNSLMILYGNVDYTRFLKLINDDYLSKYDKKEIKIDYKGVEPFDKKVEKSFKFAVSADTQTVNAAQIDYAFALTNVSEEDVIGLSILASILSEDSSPLKQEFNKRQIGGNFSVSMNSSIIQPVLTFTATGANAGKAGEFKALVDNGINDLMKNGFDKELINATISSALLSFSNITEQSNLGVNLSSNLSAIWASTDSLTYYSNLIKNTKSIAGKVDKNYFEALTKKYIANNNHAALVSTVPEAGLAEKQTEDQQKYLVALKASMSNKEIEKTVKDTKAYTEWNNSETSQQEQEIIKDLQVVKAADLPVEVKTYDLKDKKGANGERIISAKADVGETGLTVIALDTSAVPAEKLHYLQLLSSLLGKLDTENYSKEQLNILMMRYLGESGFSLTVIPEKDSDKFTPLLLTSWMGIMGEYSEQLDLEKEIMLNTKFTDSETILNNIRSQIAGMREMFTINPLSLLAMRSLALTNDYTNYVSYISGLEYYSFLEQLEKAIQADPDAVLAELDAMYKLVMNKTNMIAAFAGNEDSIKAFEKEIPSLMNALPVKKITVQDYSKLPKPAQKEGIALDTAVQYNMISAAYNKMGTEYNGKYIPIGLLLNDNYLTPVLRYGYGVYSIITEFNNTSFLAVTYRDPNIKETYDVYQGIPEYLENAEITQEELDRYILKAYSMYTASTGELNGASVYINEYLMGTTAQDRLKLLSEIKSVTVKDVKESAVVFENVLKNGTYTTVGSAAKLSENKDLFESVVAFAQETADEPITTAQFIEMLLEGIPNPVEVAKQQGLLVGDGKGNYAENELLTKERLAVFVNRVVAMNGLQLGGKATEIADADSISTWAQSSVKALVDSGVVKLDADGNFNPKETVTASGVNQIMNDLVLVLSMQ